MAGSAKQMVCVVCHRGVSLVEQEYADKISSLEGEAMGRKAFQCHACEALIYEDEIKDGRQVRAKAAEEVLDLAGPTRGAIRS